MTRHSDGKTVPDRTRRARDAHRVCCTPRGAPESAWCWAQRGLHLLGLLGMLALAGVLVRAIPRVRRQQQQRGQQRLAQQLALLARLLVAWLARAGERRLQPPPARVVHSVSPTNASMLLTACQRPGLLRLSTAAWTATPGSAASMPALIGCLAWGGETETAACFQPQRGSAELPAEHADLLQGACGATSCSGVCPASSRRVVRPAGRAQAPGQGHSRESQPRQQQQRGRRMLCPERGMLSRDDIRAPRTLDKPRGNPDLLFFVRAW